MFGMNYSILGNAQQIADLISEGAIINTYSKQDFTALHYATYKVCSK